MTSTAGRRQPSATARHFGPVAREAETARPKLRRALTLGPVMVFRMGKIVETGF